MGKCALSAQVLGTYKQEYVCPQRCVQGQQSYGSALLTVRDVVVSGAVEHSSQPAAVPLLWGGAPWLLGRLVTGGRARLRRCASAVLHLNAVALPCLPPFVVEVAPLSRLPVVFLSPTRRPRPTHFARLLLQPSTHPPLSLCHSLFSFPSIRHCRAYGTAPMAPLPRTLCPRFLPLLG